ncbi:VOC family protein [Streptomyces sp. NPDC047070]|uniref:VOC family protein n=1 Tax=Streptomyces sp. NPDC047070 TaxID=3154923 RepID=UPI003453E334
MTKPPARLIDHVALVTGDADRVAAWYRQQLGLYVAHDEFVEAAGVRLVWLYPDGVTQSGSAAALQVLEPRRPGTAMTFLTERGEGLHHVCFAVDDVAASLAAAGQPPSDAFTGGYGLPCAFLNDHSTGTVVELVQRTIPAV